MDEETPRMAVIYDRSARTFIVTLDSERAVVREHRADSTLRATASSECTKGRLRKAGQEVVNVLQRSSPTRLNVDQLRRALPHVSESTLFVRLTRLSSRGAVTRSEYSNHSCRGAICGVFKDFLYGLTTAAST